MSSPFFPRQPPPPPMPTAPPPFPPPPTPSTTDSKTFQNPCTQSPICSPSCPQFCPLSFSPPSSLLLPDPTLDPSPHRPLISPLMAALIAALAAAFFLLLYFTFFSRRRPNPRHTSVNEILTRLDPMLARPTDVAGGGLDESFIRQITVFNFHEGDGLIDSKDCAVCLSEFSDGESLRLMPNCDHAFHVHCIDTWLKTHSSCPLCRAGMEPPVALPGGTAQQQQQVSVAALRVERNDDAVLVVREVGVEREVVVVVEEDEGDVEERERKVGGRR